MISFEKIIKSFHGHVALDDVSFTVASHEFCMLVGPSGAGKSTALRLVNRLIAPDGGTIRIDDDDIATLDPVVLRRRLGYVIQSIGLFPTGASATTSPPCRACSAGRKSASTSASTN